MPASVASCLVKLMAMLVLPGPTALSPFRVNKLKDELAVAGIDVRRIDTQYFHFVDLEEKLNGKELEVLRSLLQYGAEESQRHGLMSTDHLLRLVVPRRGTISPWSSKATNIAKICGLHKVLRVERGIGYPIDTVHPGRTDPLIHDRMTEEVVGTTEVAYLFEHALPGALATIDLLGGGTAALDKANADLGLALAPDEG